MDLQHYFEIILVAILILVWIGKIFHSIFIAPFQRAQTRRAGETPSGEGAEEDLESGRSSPDAPAALTNRTPAAKKGIHTLREFLEELQKELGHGGSPPPRRDLREEEPEEREELAEQPTSGRGLTEKSILGEEAATTPLFQRVKLQARARTVEAPAALDALATLAAPEAPTGFVRASATRGAVEELRPIKKRSQRSIARLLSEDPASAFVAQEIFGTPRAFRPPPGRSIPGRHRRR